MFDSIISAVAQQFGLNDKAKPFIQMLLAYMGDPARGGLTGFVQRLRSSGTGSTIDDWLARPAEIVPLAGPVVEQAMGGDGGLVKAMASKLGFDRSTIVKALGFAVPSLLALLAQGGRLPNALPIEADNFVGNRSMWLEGGAPTVPAASVAAAPSRNWLPWVLAAVLAAMGLGYCASHRTTVPVASAPAPEVVPAPIPSIPAPVVEEPTGAAIVALQMNQMPGIKVYFDSGKADVAAEFSEKSKDLVDYLKANATARAVISGFNDPTGDPVANAALSKSRAIAVQRALSAAGVPNEQTILEKPEATTGTGSTNAASRRVDVAIRKAP